MDILRIALASFKFGTKVGNKAVEVATRPSLLSDAAWAKLIMRELRMHHRVSGSVLTDRMRRIAEDFCRAATDAKPTWQRGCQMEGLVGAICEGAKKGDVNLTTFFVPVHEADEVAKNDAFLAFRKTLQRQNMDAELIFKLDAVKVRGLVCYTCCMTVVWQPHMQYNP
jgi:hypothetical protein